MSEQQTTTEGAGQGYPRRNAGSKTDNPCPNPATTSLWGSDYPPGVCEYHERRWVLNDELGQLETSSAWLETYEGQASMVDLGPLTEALASVRERVESEIARLKREEAELEEERARG